MGYKLWCKGCGHNYYTLGSNSWYKSGTNTEYPTYGYCCCCGANETNPGRSWKGNVAKIECAACTNLITVITWYDWRNRSGEDAGYCNGCRSDFGNKKNSWNSLKSKASSCSWASVGWDGWSSYSSLKSACFKIKCHSKSHNVYNGSDHSSISNYLSKSRCPECVRYEAAQKKSNFCPDYYTFSKPDWCRVIKTIDLSNWVWKKCEIYCNQKQHNLHYEVSLDGNDGKPAKHWHNVFTSTLNESECPTCAQEKEDEKEKERQTAAAQQRQQQAKQKIKQLNDNFNKLFPENEIKGDEESGYTESNDIKQQKAKLDKFEDEFNKQIQELIDLKIEASSFPQKTADLLDTLSEKKTYKDEKELEADIEQLKDQRQEAIQLKKNLEDKENQLLQQENELLDQENQLNKQKKTENEAKLTGSNKKQELDKFKQVLSNANISTKDGGESLKALTDKIDKVQDELEAKYIGNQELSKQLNDCGDRIRKIKAKLKKEKSECKYLCGLLQDEMSRLSNATDDAMDKFEKRTQYFLAAELGLGDDIIDKFVDGGFEKDDIINITEEELIEEVEIQDKKIRKKVLRLIKNYKKTNK